MRKTLEDEHRCLYNVQRDMENAPKGRQLSVDKSSAHVCCSCQMFESDGIPCRHMLAYFTTMQIRKLPEQYILRRWTQSAKAGRVRENLVGGLKEICDTALVVRRSKIFKRASNVIEDAVLTEAGTAIMDEALEFAEKKLAALKIGSNDGDGDGDAEGSAIDVTTLASQHSCKEPLPVRSKGCGKRMMGGKEKAVKKAVKKARRCNGCGLTGQSHDKRNCPKLLGLSSQDVRFDDDDDDDDDNDDGDDDDSIYSNDD